MGELGDNATKLLAQRAVVGEALRHQCPKTRGVIELAQVAKFVDYHVVAQHLGQQRHFVIKIKIPPRRAAPPPRAGVAYKNFVVSVSVRKVVVSEPLVHNIPRHLAVFIVMTPTPPPHVN